MFHVEFLNPYVRAAFVDSLANCRVEIVGLKKSPRSVATPTTRLLISIICVELTFINVVTLQTYVQLVELSHKLLLIVWWT